MTWSDPPCSRCGVVVRDPSRDDGLCTWCALGREGAPLVAFATEIREVEAGLACARYVVGDDIAACLWEASDRLRELAGRVPLADTCKGCRSRFPRDMGKRGRPFVHCADCRPLAVRTTRWPSRRRA